VHADTDVGAADRAALERLVRDGARPPFAHQRLARTRAGKIAYRLRRPWSGGQTEIVLEPVALLRRLAALIPPPRQHQLRYHGVFAGRAADRAAIAQLVPPPDSPRASAHHRPARPTTCSPPPHRLAARRLPWAELFRRAFREDLLVCPRCEGPVEIIAALVDPAVTRRVLDHLGLAAEPVAIAPARGPPQHDLWPDGVEFDSADAPA